MCMPRTFLLSLILLLSLPASPQSITTGWNGWAQCKINVQGPNAYAHQETHTWQITGGAPTSEGVIRLYPATWSETGQGGFQKKQVGQSLFASWTTNATGVSGPIAFFFRASDHKLIVKSGHAQLRVHGGVTGTQQQIVGDKPSPAAPIALEAFEWPFPAVGGAFRPMRKGVPLKELRIEGSNSAPTTGSVGPMQPGGSQGTAACTWAFVQGSTPRPLPATP